MRYIEKKIFNWEVVGVFWIIIVGALLHFAYEFSGNSSIVGMIAPVNESLWEHLKLGYWALVPFLVIEYFFIGKHVNGFFIGKALGILTLEIFIVVVFYSYMTITKEPVIFIDIGSFLVGAILCQLVSFNILKRKVFMNYDKLGIGILIFIGLIFILFTFYPPHLPMFKDRSTGKYGID